MRGMIAKQCRKKLLALATAYAKHHDIELKTVSGRFYGNTVFFDDFRDGKKTLSLEKFDEVWTAFREGWPEGLRWPFETDDPQIIV